MLSVSVPGVFLGVVCGLLAATGRAQQPPAPSFRTIDLLTAEASVFDKDGRPVADLQPAEFTALVDGKPRSVVVARFLGSRPRGTPAVPSPVPTSSAFISSAAAGPGRIAILAIDLESILAGEEQSARDIAATFVDALSPRDAAGLLGFPRVTVNLTRDHARVRDALRDLFAAQPKPVEPASGALSDTAGAKTRSTLTALGGLVDRLAAIRSPKHLVLISGGLPVEPDSMGLYQDLAHRAAAAQVTVYVIHVGRDRPEGLVSLATMSGGAFYSGATQATGDFGRVVSEIDSYYELGIEPAAGDADGNAHHLDVNVARPGLTLRSRRDVIAPAPPASGDPLLDLLSQPLDVTELPIAVATYAMRGEKPDMLRLLVSAEIGGSAALRAPVEWGFAILDGDAVVASYRQTAGARTGTPLVTTASTPLESGRYRLRVAAMDADRRAAVFDVPLVAGLRAVGDFRMSDLIVGDARGERLQPAPIVARGSAIVAAAEIYADDQGMFAGAVAELQLFAEGSAQPVASGPMSLKPGPSALVRLAEGGMNAAGLAPGHYTASAIVRVSERIVGKVSRSVEIIP